MTFEHYPKSNGKQTKNRSRLSVWGNLTLCKKINSKWEEVALTIGQVAKITDILV